jgi:plastocyanin
MNKWLAVLCSVLVLVLGLVAAGCGGDDNGGGGGGGGGGSSQKPAPSSGGGGGKSATVVMKNIAFEPKGVTVAKGGRVKWTNDDSVGHDVTKQSGPGPKFSSGSAGGMQKGDTFQQKFTTAGTIKYECTVHPNMRGATIIVK